MQLSVFAWFSLFGLFAQTLASPVVAESAVSKRQVAPLAATLQTLYTSIQQYTGVINATVASLPPGADDATKATASAKVNAAISEITGLLNAATTSVKPPIKRDVESVEKRQGVDEAAVVALIGLLLLELSGTLSAVIAALGLTSLLSVLQPLLLGLSGLVLALALVIDGLLLLLGTLLTGILTGLSVALAGLAL